jgi:hypothetical protein
MGDELGMLNLSVSNLVLSVRSLELLVRANSGDLSLNGVPLSGFLKDVRGVIEGETERLRAAMG